MEYADISELDDKAKYLRATWGKMINYASTFTRAYLEIQAEFVSGKYGPEWSFERWLGVKCGMSERTTYRVIEQLHRTATDEQRDKIKSAVAEANRKKHQEAVDKKARKIALSAWLAEEKLRKAAVHAAMIEYEREERERIKAEKAAAKEANKKEKQRLAANERQRKRRRDKNAKKVNENKDLPDVTLFDAKSENPLPKRQSNAVYKSFVQLRVALAKLPIDERKTCVERIIAHLESLLESSITSDRDKARANGHNTEQKVVFLTTPHRD